MKKIRNLLVLSCVLLGLSGCSDWLTIQPETQITEEDMFKTQGGFYDALTGCYVLMRNNYSPDGVMVLGATEYMANLWYTNVQSGTSYEYVIHNYRADLVDKTLSQLFLNQYEIIANTNNLLEHIDAQDNVLSSGERDLYKGEVLGLRAFIHFDLIRLWGPMPTQVNENYLYLPYALTVQLENHPYSNYRNYMTQLCADLDSAELLLQRVDPAVAGNAYQSTYGSYRKNRMNYYAVLGLQARVHLWLGEREEALRYARLVRDAVNESGSKVFSLGTQSDLNRYDRVLYSSEQLFGVSLEEFADNLVADGNTPSFSQTTARLTDLFPSRDIRSQLWYAARGDNRSPNKYGNMASYDTETPAPNFSVPLIRLSEMYLIIAECADLTEANTAYTEFLAARGLETTELTEANREGILQLEYLKEFYGEGQMFYVYKRLGTVTMRWSERANGVDDYVLPLPSRELSTTEN
ncbi:RagB/SusD family nutrient uptake outer membrane protein [Odoribacter sp. AF15-53]|uniref:RagB/SusD family nutrient uptake outer membrane protein n=1 Tax=Odoribacter sp. AF15-53 TaxID=2292236 RepID=UPI000E4C9FC0|nr:RagB/SusD family nutrient uptake outer membrane protein [Odoribacter sp. AF15-53]RHR78299.1 RagB/SusD family nutrient uptake outer membrane protein [Odoribacter sp. AF15-53]